MNLQSQNTLIYVGDPMCSWCYGIAPELQKLVDAQPDYMDFEMVMGGLRPYNTETMADLKDFLAEHWDQVEKASGQKFNHEILNSTEFVYDTEPPTRAFAIIQKSHPEKSLAFFAAIQHAFYYDNLDTHNPETYIKLLKEIGVESEDFTSIFESDEAKNLSKEHFKLANQLGANSFPTILLKTGETYSMIAKGYADAQQMQARIDKVMENYYREKK